MEVKYGNGTTEYDIEITGDEIATAIDAYLVAHGVRVSVPRTIRVNGELIESGNVYVDPSGFVVESGGGNVNRTQYGNIAIGTEGSIARFESDIAFLAEKLRLMEYAADKLRDHFVPNDEEHTAIQAYNAAKMFRG